MPGLPVLVQFGDEQIADVPSVDTVVVPQPLGEGAMPGTKIGAVVIAAEGEGDEIFPGIAGGVFVDHTPCAGNVVVQLIWIFSRRGEIIVCKSGGGTSLLLTHKSYTEIGVTDALDQRDLRAAVGEHTRDRVGA